MTYRLGIDLGTTNLVAAVGYADGAAELLTLGPGRPEAPVAALRSTGSAADQATAALLRLAVDRAHQQVGGPPDEIVLAVPGWWGDVEQLSFDAGVDLAGLGTARRIDQAEAAALSYAARVYIPVGARVAVFHLGGGSCAASVLERVSDGFTVMAAMGAEHPCGNDFDEAVSRLVVAGLGDRFREPADPEAASEFRRAYVTAREAVSTQPRADIAIAGVADPVSLGRPEVEGLVRGPLREAIDLVSSAMREVGVAPSDLVAILGVGGCCRMPLVRAMLAKEFRVPIEVTGQPELETALGSVGGAETCRAATPPVAAPPAPPPQRSASSVPVESTSVPAVWSGPAHPGAGWPEAANAQGTGPNPSRLVEPPAAQQPQPPAQQAARPAVPDTAPPVPSPVSRSAEPPAPPTPQPVRSSAPAAELSVALTRPAPPSPVSAPPSGGSWTGQPAPAWRTTTPAVTTPVRARPGAAAWLGYGLGGVAVVVAVALAIWLLPIGGAPSTPSASQASTAAPPKIEPPGGAAQTLAALPKGKPLSKALAVVPMRPASGMEGLYVVSTTGAAKPKRLSTPAGSPTNPMMQPDRRTIIYLQGGTLRVMASDDKTTGRKLWSQQPDGCPQVMHASWNRLDPTTLLVSCQRTPTSMSLVAVDLNGVTLRTLAAAVRVGDFSVSPDGKTVVYWANGRPKANGGPLYQVSFDHPGTPTLLTATTSVYAHPAWSPDGATLSFSNRVQDGKADANWDVYTMAAKPKAKRVAVATGPADDMKAVWSPDGRRLLVISNRVSAGASSAGESYDLWLLARDGTPRIHLGLKAKRLTRPFWSLR